MQPPTLVILAAGLGSRYGGFKQIDPVGPAGEVVLDYSAFDAWRAGFRKVVFVVKPELEAPLREHVAGEMDSRLEIAYAHQSLSDLPAGHGVPEGRTKPWGTGHAIWTARRHVDTPFAVVNADDFYGRGSYAILGDFLTQQERTDTCPTFCMVAFRLLNTLSEHGTVCRGICETDGDGFLVDVAERTNIELRPDGSAGFSQGNGWRPLTGEEPASLNLWGFTPEIFDLLASRFRDFLAVHGNSLKDEFFIPTAVDELVKAGRCRVAVLHTDEQWFGMTYQGDRKRVVNSIASLTEAGAYADPLWS